MLLGSSYSFKRRLSSKELMLSNCGAAEDSESPLDSKIEPVNPKGNQPWIFTGRTDAEAEAPILWPHDAKSQLTGKDPDAGNDWGQEEKGEAEDEMVGWHHRLNGHEFEQALGDGEGQGSLAYCSPWGHKESNTTEWLNNSNNNYNPALEGSFPNSLFVTCFSNRKKPGSHYPEYLSLLFNSRIKSFHNC